MFDMLFSVCNILVALVMLIVGWVMLRFNHPIIKIIGIITIIAGIVGILFWILALTGMVVLGGS
jgi:hypothetical protein